jgi:hypothetical protein
MLARGGELRAAATIALMVAVAAGCGGGPSAEETRAELRRWASAVDDICRTTREDITARGGAFDARDLDRVAARASDDVRAAIDRIRRVPISEEARPRVRPFLAELAKVEPRLREMTRTTANGSLKEIGDLGLRLADVTRLLQDRADAAGLRDCADTKQFDAVLDAFTAPVYATQIARFEIWFARALRPLSGHDTPTSAELVRHLRRVGSVFDRAERRLDDLYVYRPNRAVEAADDVEFALDAYEEFVTAVADSLRGGRRIFTPIGAKRFRRGVAKHQREVRRAFAELSTAIGAQPLAVPGAPRPLEPERYSA